MGDVVRHEHHAAVPRHVLPAAEVPLGPGQHERFDDGDHQAEPETAARPGSLGDALAVHFCLLVSLLPSVMGESCLMSDLQVASWILVIPVKRTAIAKSRLAAAYPQHRPELARAFAVDTTAAALDSPLVRAVLVVTDDPVVSADVTAVGAHVVPDLPGAWAQRGAGARCRGRRRASTQAWESRRCQLIFLRCGRPSCLPFWRLASGPQLRDRPARNRYDDACRRGRCPLDPRFGVGSALAHQASGAVPIDCRPSTRYAVMSTPRRISRTQYN